MSLTSFVKLKDVKEHFRETFPQPKVMLVGELKAPPLTKNYALVGTAFDYLLRFYLERKYDFCKSGTWVAETSLMLLKELTLVDSSMEPVAKQVKAILDDARLKHKEYIETGELNDDLLRICLKLGKIDSIRRSGRIPEDMNSVDELDVKDLRNLLEIVDEKLFSAKKICLLNPTFGDASSLVDGADADIVMDNQLIDVKTTKFLKLKEQDLHQIIGYYILSKLGKLEDAPKNLEIDKIGIYFSRYGVLRMFEVPSLDSKHFPISEEKFSEFVEWFEKRAEKEFS